MRRWWSTRCCSFAISRWTWKPRRARPPFRRLAHPPGRQGSRRPSRSSADPCRRQFDPHRRRELALGRLLRPGAADGQHPPSAHGAAHGRRHAVRQHVRGLRGAVRPRMKAYLEGLTATHAGDHVYRGRYRGGHRRHRQGLSHGRRIRSCAAPGDRAQAALCQPDLHRHDQRAREDESDAILDFLYQHPAQRNSRCGSAGSRIRWRSGTIAASSTWPCGTTIPRSAPATA